MLHNYLIEIPNYATFLSFQDKNIKEMFDTQLN